ncbi:MAG: alpha/beta hydrolase family protein [Steroidobacteraceae bacterium]
MRPFALATLLIPFIVMSHAGAEAPPRPVVRDPPKDALHPPRMASIQITSHGEAMNAVFYLAGGAGPHPTVLLLHGSPGNEQNLDLAQAIRRAGWNTLTLHYRGSWGSAGRYSLANCIEDSQAAVAFIRDPKVIQQYGLERGRVVVVGHSMGGFLAARLGAQDPSLMGIAMFGAWDVGHDGPIMANWSKAMFDEEFGDIPGRVVGATGRSLVAEAVAHEKDWSLDAFAPGLAKHKVLIVIPHDFDRDSELKLASTLKGMGAPVTSVDIDTDHPFSDSRIALQAAVVRWLGSLPGAPTQP